MNIKIPDLKTDLVQLHLYDNNKKNIVFRNSSTNNDEFVKSTNTSYADKTNWYKIGVVILTAFAVLNSIYTYKTCKKLKTAQKALEESKTTREKKLKELEVNIHKLKEQIKQKDQELKNFHHKVESTYDKTCNFDKYDYISQKIESENKTKNIIL